MSPATRHCIAENLIKSLWPLVKNAEKADNQGLFYVASHLVVGYFDSFYSAFAMSLCEVLANQELYHLAQNIWGLWEVPKNDIPGMERKC